MVEAKKCVRCGCMYISNSEVCGKCQTKDGADLYKLKGFLDQSYGEVTQKEISLATGISDKNLSRFLQYDEFKGVCINENIQAASAKNIQEIENGIELV